MRKKRVNTVTKAQAKEEVKAITPAVEKTVEDAKVVVEAVAAKAEETKKAVEAKAEETKKAVETKAEETKKAVAAKTEETKKAVETKAEETKSAVEKKAKTAKTAVKKAAAKATAKAVEVNTKVIIQYQNNEAEMDKLEEKIKTQFVADGHRISSIKKLNIYVKPEDYSAYYVINEKFFGRVDLF